MLNIECRVNHVLDNRHTQDYKLTNNSNLPGDELVGNVRQPPLRQYALR